MDNGEACAASVSAQPFEAAFHPSAPLLVASLITGHLEVRRPPPPPSRRALVFPHTSSMHPWAQYTATCSPRFTGARLRGLGTSVRVGCREAERMWPPPY